MASIVLYDRLVAESTNAVTTGGTWTYTGVPVVFPAAPGAWNGSVDFTGYATDIYQYTYTVTPVGACDPIASELDVDLRTRIATPNDECVTAYAHAYTDAAPVSSKSYLDENLAGSCEDGLDGATLSVDALPATWPATANADLWYKVSIDTTTTVVLFVIVDGGAYTDTVDYPYVTIYSGACGGLSEQVTGIPSGSHTVQASYVHTSGALVNYFIRVGCDTGNEGRYNIGININ